VETAELVRMTLHDPALNLNVSAWSERSGVSRGTISSYRDGGPPKEDPSPIKLDMLARGAGFRDFADWHNAMEEKKTTADRKARPQVPRDAWVIENPERVADALEMILRLGAVAVLAVEAAWRDQAGSPLQSSRRSSTLEGRQA
jgi:hypothetical protein